MIRPQQILDVVKKEAMRHDRMLSCCHVRWCQGLGIQLQAAANLFEKLWKIKNPTAEQLFQVIRDELFMLMAEKKSCMDQGNWGIRFEKNRLKIDVINSILRQIRRLY